MADNPYQVLGVSPSATPEEIKAAYRTMVKKYHPDRYAGSPLEAQAQEKLKRINLAYDEITNRNGNSTGQANGYAGYSGGATRGPTGGARGPTGSASGEPYSAVYTMMQRGRLMEAYALLHSVPPQGRDAEWYFIAGCIAQRRGWSGEAQEHFEHAVDMDPGNELYRATLEHLREENGYYERMRARRQRRYEREADSVPTSCCCCMEPCCEMLGCVAIPCCCI